MNWVSDYRVWISEGQLYNTCISVPKVQSLEVMPFIEEILNNIRAIICDLQPQQVHTFYEAVGYMIQAQGVRESKTPYLLF